MDTTLLDTTLLDTTLRRTTLWRTTLWRTTIAALLCASLSAAPASAYVGESVALRSTPKPDQRITHAFVLEHTLVVQRLATRVGSDVQISQDQLEFGGRTSLRFVDRVREVAGGRPTLFSRLLEGADVHVDMRLQPTTGPARPLALEGTSPLKGASVLFRYLPESRTYGRMYDDLETSEEFLPRISVAIDLSCFLPDAPVEVGSSWKIAPGRIEDVFAYGGLVPIRFAQGADPQLVRTVALGVAGPLDPVFGGTTTGTCDATLTAVEGGIARVALKLDLRSAKDQTAFSQEILTPPERYDGVRVEKSTIAWGFRGAGELRWDVAAGRAVSLALAGAEDVRVTLDLDGPGGAGGSDLTLAGGMKLAVDVTGN